MDFRMPQDRELNLIAAWIGGQLKWMVILPTIKSVDIIHEGRVDRV